MSEYGLYVTYGPMWAPARICGPSRWTSISLLSAYCIEGDLRHAGRLGGRAICLNMLAMALELAHEDRA